jgi:hypothetical protein
MGLHTVMCHGDGAARQSAAGRHRGAFGARAAILVSAAAPLAALAFLMTRPAFRAEPR